MTPGIFRYENKKHFFGRNQRLPIKQIRVQTITLPVSNINFAVLTSLNAFKKAG
jgi:hypothetical protein